MATAARLVRLVIQSCESQGVGNHRSAESSRSPRPAKLHQQPAISTNFTPTHTYRIERHTLALPFPFQEEKGRARLRRARLSP